MDLYRAGTPSIGEVWLRRFHSGRSTGGLGTGVYAFRTEDGAAGHVNRARSESGIFHLKNALDNPLQPSTLEATEELVDLSRAMSMFAERAIENPPDYDDAIARIEDGNYVDVNPLGGIFSERGFAEQMTFPDDPNEIGAEVLWGSEDVDRRDNIQSMLRTIFSDTPGFSILDTEDFAIELIEATREAERRAKENPDAAVQPINIALYPEYDGIAPLDGAGGNTGKHGCVMFKQKIDECVGRETESFEEIPAETLNDCFSQ